MDKVLIRKLLDSGVMVSPDVAGEITERDYDTVLAKKLKTVDKNTLSEIRSGQGIVIEKPEIARNEITAKDFLNYYKNKILALAPFITARLDDKPVSMNRARFGQRNTILGLVREPTESGFVLEDLTGHCEVALRTKEDVAENDVVAATGFFSDNKLFAERITHPELTIKKRVRFSEKECSAIFAWAKAGTGNAIKNIANKKGECFVFIFSGDDRNDGSCAVMRIENGSVTSENVFPNAAKATITTGNAKFVLQNLRANHTDGIESQARFFSKRRYIGDDKIAPAFLEDPFVIDQETDIILLGKSDKTGVANNKGYTFIAVGCADDGEPAVRIDLKTRSAEMTSF
ncbi:MAG: hypothetical protein V1836_00535 [Candidatus Aenigmatarchaeota archaeon]